MRKPIFTDKEKRELLAELASKERKSFLKARRFIIKRSKEKQLFDILRIAVPNLSVSEQDYEIAINQAVHNIWQQRTRFLRFSLGRSELDIQATTIRQLEMGCLTKTEEYGFENLEASKRLTLIQDRCEQIFYAYVKDYYESQESLSNLRMHLADALIYLNKKIKRGYKFTNTNLTGYLFNQFKVQLGLTETPLTAGLEEKFLTTIDSFHEELDNIIKAIRVGCFDYYFSSFSRKYELSETEFNQVYNDALLGLKTNLLGNKFERKSSIATYLYSIINFKSLDFIRKNRPSKDKEEKEEKPITPKPAIKVKKRLEHVKRNQQQGLYRQAMEILDEKCRNMLIDESEGSDLETLAKDYGFKTEESAGSKISKCKRKLRKTIEDLSNENE